MVDDLSTHDAGIPSQESISDVGIWNGTTWTRVTLATLAGLLSPLITKQPPTVGQAVIDLGAMLGKGGLTAIEGNGLFAASQIGKPVVVTMAPSTATLAGQPVLVGRVEDEDADELALFVGRIVSTSRMVVRWCAVNSPMRGLVRVNYVIGS